MTAKQREIIKWLFDGGYIIKYGNAYKLRSKNHSPISKFHYRTFKRIRNVLKQQSEVWVISKSAVISLHGKNWIKQYYKQIKNQNNGKN